MVILSGLECSPCGMIALFLTVVEDWNRALDTPAAELCSLVSERLSM